MIRLLVSLHYLYMRRLDRVLLWPACKAAAEERGMGINAAKAAFASHAFNDPPWQHLGRDETIRQIDRLS
jgi:hypothetical protein